jgi:hypothetical protein
VADLLRKLSGEGQILEGRLSDEIAVVQEYRGISPTSVLDQVAEAISADVAGQVYLADIPPAATSV